MRYAIAMLFAVIGAAAAMFLVSSGVADFVVARYRFASADEAANLHMAAFMGSSFAGLVAGWILGWTAVWIAGLALGSGAKVD